MKHFLLVLKTLINNSACVEASRTKQIKYNIIAVALALVGLFLAVLPTGVTSFKKSGSDWMNTTYVYNCDLGFYNFTKDSKEKGTTLTVTKEGNAKILKADWKHIDYVPLEKEQFDGLKNRMYSFKHVVDGTNVRVFDVYNLTDKEGSELTTWVSDLLNNLNPTIAGDKNTEARWLQYSEKDGKKSRVERSTSCVFFGKKIIYAYMFKTGTTSPVSNMGGDYGNCDDVELISTYYAENDPITTYNNWKPFFNKAYLNVRWSSSWKSIGIMLGVDAGVLIFMGLMVFILTRGKNNPFRIYTFWDSQKIAYYASFTPSLLALGFGFLLTNMAMMFYILVLGIRVMWLSMRTLRYDSGKK